MAGRFRASVRQMIHQVGCKVGVFRANPGPPLPGEIWLQVREANVWVARPHPPSLGSKHSRRLGDGPKHPGPPLLFIPGLPSFSGAWSWLFNLSLSWATRVEVRVKVPGASSLTPHSHC